MSPSPSSSAEENASHPPPSSSPNLLEPARADVFNFRFSADINFKEKFERLAEVLGVENPLKNMAEVFERAMDISLEKKDPKKKLERRLQRERKRSELEKARPDEVETEGDAPSHSDNRAASRYIPSEVRERVLARAGYQCQYCASDGTRCSSRTALEIEHQRPFAIYRSHEERYLKVLCHRHNRFQAERVYGADFIRTKIEEKKRQKLSRRGVRQSTTSKLPIDAEGNPSPDEVDAPPHFIPGDDTSYFVAIRKARSCPPVTQARCD
jgi:hypothetical protein